MKYANLYLETNIKRQWACASLRQKAYLVMFILWLRLTMMQSTVKRRNPSRSVLTLALWASVVGFIVRIISTDVDSWSALAALFLSCMMLCLIGFASLWILVTSFVMVFNWVLSEWSARTYPTSQKEAITIVELVANETAKAAAQAYIMAFSHRSITQVTIALSMVFASEQEVNLP